MTQNTERLEKYKLNLALDNYDDIDNKIKDNNKKIIDKQLRMDNIIEENAALEYLIDSLDDDSRKLLELRYKKDKGYQYMVYDFNLSKSAIARRNIKLVKKIELELMDQREAIISVG